MTYLPDDPLLDDLSIYLSTQGQGMSWLLLANDHDCSVRLTHSCSTRNKA